MKNKNILLVIAGLANGGAENQIVKLWKLLNENGYNCYLLILNKKEKVDLNFQNIIESDKFLSLELSSQDRFLFFKILRGLNEIYKKNKIDTVISYLHVANIFTRISKIFIPKLKVITSIRSDFEVQYNIKNKLVEYMLSPLSNQILSNSKATVAYLNKRLIVNNKAKYFPNIINCVKIVSLPERYEIFTIIAVGRLAKEKNYDFLIDVAFELKNKPIRFMILGDGNQRVAIEKRIELLNLTNIEMIGQVKNVNNYLQKSHLFFMPSLYEGLSNAMIEAICSNLVVFCSSKANTSELIENNQNGFVFSNYDVKEVASVIENIRKLEHNKYFEIASKAKVKVQNEMSEKNILQTLKEYI